MELPEDWETVLQRLSKNRRKKHRQLAKNLEGKTELYQATDADSLREGLQILESLHTARWNSLGEEGCFGHPGFRQHIHLMAKEKLASKTLSLIWLTFKGQPIAADIGFLRGDESYKAQFKSEKTDNMRCEIVHPSVRAKSIHALLQIGRLVKSFLK